MTQPQARILMIATAFAACLAMPLAHADAQAAGVTSGPAAGTNVRPSDSGDSNNHADKANSQNTAAHTGDGAPGVKAKSGSESGPAPKDAPQPR